MRILVMCIFCTFLFVATVAAQTDCPADKVCISRDAALKALADADRVKALESENTVLKDAIEGKDGYKALLANMKIEFARMSGENTALKENAVSDRAIMTVLVANSRKKCMPLSILCL